jgi:hypothetical protein
MTDEEQLAALQQPTTSLPPGFKVPPGMPTPTAADFAEANKPKGAGIGQSKDAISWTTWALALGGAALVGGIAYAAYRATTRRDALLKPFEPSPLPSTVSSGVSSTPLASAKRFDKSDLDRSQPWPGRSTTTWPA